LLPSFIVLSFSNDLSKNFQERLETLKSLEDQGFITKNEAAVKLKAIMEGL
jgi:hypothetical protein